MRLDGLKETFLKDEDLGNGNRRLYSAHNVCAIIDAWLDEVLLIGDAAEETGYSRQGLHWMCRTGKVPYVLVPKGPVRKIWGIRRRDLPLKVAATTEEPSITEEEEGHEF